MASPVTPVSQQVAWSIQPTNDFFDEAAALSDPDFYSHTDDIGTDWPTVLTGSDQRVVLDISSIECNNVLLKFYGNPASSAIVSLPSTVRTGLVGVWGVSALNGATEYVGDYLGKVMIEVGSKEVASSAVLPDSGDTNPAFWARHIGVQDDRALFPGMRVVGEEGEASPVLVIDTMGYSRLIIEMRRVAVGPTLTTADPVAAAFLGFLYRFL